MDYLNNNYTGGKKAEKKVYSEKKNTKQEQNDSQDDNLSEEEVEALLKAFED